MNKNTFKSEMIKPELGYKVTGTLLDFFDEGKQSSTFYSNLIKLFQATKKDPATKDCIYTFIQTKEEGGNFYIYLQPDTKGCVGKIGNIQNFNTFGFTLFKDSNALGMKKVGTSKQETGNETKTTQQEKDDAALAQFYGALDPVIQKIEAGRPTQAPTQTESLTNDINRIKKLIHG